MAARSVIGTLRCPSHQDDSLRQTQKMITVQEPSNGDSNQITLEEESHWARLAQLHWSKPGKTKRIRPNVLKTEIWDVLEREGFQTRSLLELESLQVLEKYAAKKSTDMVQKLIKLQLPMAWL